MRHNRSIIIFSFLLSLLLTQCKESHETDGREQAAAQLEVAAPDAAYIITGIVHNRDKYPNTKSLQVELPAISGEKFKIASPIDDDGTFYFRLETNAPLIARMPPFLDVLYVVPNDSLHIELDFDDLTKVKLSGGQSVKINTEFYDYFNETFYRGIDYSLGTDLQLNSSIAEIRKLLDDKKALFRERRKAFLEREPVCEEVRSVTEAMIELDYYLELIQAQFIREMRGKEIIGQAALLEEINQHAIGYFSKGMYTDSHFSLIGSMIYTLFPGKTTRVWNTAQPSLPIEDLPNDTIRNLALARQASNELQIKNLKGFDEIFPQISDAYLQTRLQREHKITLERMKNPEAISSSITGIQNDLPLSSSADNILSGIISQHKGKVLVIDIWSTWCGPCIAEFPHYRSLIDKYDKEEVVFAFICSGGDEQRVRQLLQKHGLDNEQHIFCTKEDFQFLATTFSPIAFPYGLLVNKKGVIVDYGTHVRASMLSQKIDLLLTQDKLIDN